MARVKCAGPGDYTLNPNLGHLGLLVTPGPYYSHVSSILFGDIMVPNIE